MKSTKITPLLVVEAIEPALALYTSLGFTATVEVPHGLVLGFVILAGPGGEIMLQTRASFADDLPALAALGTTHALYVEVDGLDDAAAGAQVIVPKRTTFYGAHEIWVRDPTGAILAFAHHPK